MAWCPKCKSEFREGFTFCNKCEVQLVDELEKPVEPPEISDTEAFLTSAQDGLHADIFEAKLTDNGIPVLKKYREAGGILNIYMGETPFGVDLYVPSKLLDSAREIIAESEVSVEETSEDTPLKEDENSYKRKMRFRAWIILLFFIPGFIWALYMIISILVFAK